MDGLSAAASVIAVIQAANAVISLCYEFRAVLKDAPRPLTLILEEVRDLRNVLEKVEKLSRQEAQPELVSEKASQNLQIVCQSAESPLSSISSDLAWILKTLQRCQHPGQRESKWRALKEVFHMWLKEDDVKRRLTRIERCKSTLSLSLTADATTLLLDIQDLSLELKSSILKASDEVAAISGAMRRKEISESHTALLRWLCTTMPAEHHERMLDAIVPGTCTWLMDCTTFKDWLETPNSLLWLTGPPGTGKSSLFASTVAHCNDINIGMEVAYHYFDFRNRETNTVLDMMGSLVAQVCKSPERVPDALRHEFENSETAGQRMRPKLDSLREALKLVAETRPLCIMIDALDECADSVQIANVIEGLLQMPSSNVKIFLTSRPLPELVHQLITKFTIRLEDQRVQQAADIGLYTEARLASDARLSRLSDDTQAEIMAAIDARGDGMFRWVQCQMDSISALRTTRAIRLALNELPQGLHETYGNILRRVPSADQQLVRKILLWVTFSFGPLTISKIHEALAIEPGQDDIDDDNRLSTADEVLVLCGSLVSTSDDQILRPAHLSVVDYLLSDAIQSDSTVAMFALNREDANGELLTDCLTYLSLKEMARGPCNPARYEWRRNYYFLLRYAAVAWPYHFEQCRPSENLTETVLRFLTNEPVFMSWVQVLSHGDLDTIEGEPTPLYYASSFGLLDVVQSLLKRGVDKDVQAGRFGGTAIQAAVWRGHPKVLTALLEAGADPNVADCSEASPLHFAAGDGDEELIRMLLEHGASYTVQDDEGKTPVHWAMRHGRTALLRLLRSMYGLYYRSDGSLATVPGASDWWSDELPLTSASYESTTWKRAPVKGIGRTGESDDDVTRL